MRDKNGTVQHSADAYEEAYERIEGELIAANLAEGGDANYKPSYAEVHPLVMKELDKVAREGDGGEVSFAARDSFGRRMDD